MQNTAQFFLYHFHLVLKETTFRAVPKETQISTLILVSDIPRCVKYSRIVHLKETRILLKSDCIQFKIL